MTSNDIIAGNSREKFMMAIKFIEIFTFLCTLSFPFLNTYNTNNLGLCLGVLSYKYFLLRYYSTLLSQCYYSSSIIGINGINSNQTWVAYNKQTSLMPMMPSMASKTFLFYFLFYLFHFSSTIFWLID